MTNAKVTVTKEVAEALTELLTKNSADDILDSIIDGRRLGGDLALRNTPVADVIKALFRGYEVEKSPEDKVREYYNQAVIDSENPDYEISEPGLIREGAIIQTLNLLGIKIGGVNA